MALRLPDVQSAHGISVFARPPVGPDSLEDAASRRTPPADAIRRAVVESGAAGGEGADLEPRPEAARLCRVDDGAQTGEGVVEAAGGALEPDTVTREADPQASCRGSPVQAHTRCFISTWLVVS